MSAIGHGFRVMLGCLPIPGTENKHEVTANCEKCIRAKDIFP